LVALQLVALQLVVLQLVVLQLGALAASNGSTLIVPGSHVCGRHPTKVSSFDFDRYVPRW
jgi:ectoine hydroxylase-related dioxygenase (phytanoyl-CoA dioxygenase family)